MIRLIAAIDRKRGLARKGAMPWKIPQDERYFTRQTRTHGGNVLTGAATFRKSYRGRPLAGRHNYILTHSKEPIPGAVAVHDLEEFLRGLSDDLWVAGGADVFRQVIGSGMADELYLTRIDADLDCDQFFPEYEHDFRLVERSGPHEQNGYGFVYERWARQDR